MGSACSVSGTPRPACVPEGLDHGIAWRTEDLDPGRGVERFGICLRGALANNAHVELHGCRGMHLHDATSLPSARMYSLNASRRGSLASMNATSPGTRSHSASRAPGLRRLVAMKMNGADIRS